MVRQCGRQELLALFPAIVFLLLVHTRAVVDERSFEDAEDESAFAFPKPQEEYYTVNGTSQSRGIRHGHFLTSSGYSPRPTWVHHHIWKCGGSNLCDIALRNGEHAPSTDREPCDRCNYFTWQNSGYGGYSYVQMQKPLAVGFPPKEHNPGVMFSVMLRDPLRLAASHFHHVKSKKFKGSYTDSNMNLVEWAKLGLCRLRTGKPGPAQECLDEFFESVKERVSQEAAENEMQRLSKVPSDYFQYFQDNMQTRWLAPAVEGTVFDHLENRGGQPLDDATLNNALANLRHYDRVLILEEFSARDAMRMARDLHWSPDTVAHPEPQVGTHRIKKERELSDEERSFLEDACGLDLQLYEAAKAIAADQAARGL